jgi:hypothetical protein
MDKNHTLKRYIYKRIKNKGGWYERDNRKYLLLVQWDRCQV